MSFELPALLWLEAKHLRAELNFWLWAAGTDLDEARDVAERAYLAYLVVIVGAAVAACWLWILGLVVGAAQASGPEEAALLADLGRLIAGAALALPATAAAAWTVRAAWRAPWIPSPADVVWLTQQPISIISWSAIELAKRIVVRATVFTCTGYLVAAFALASTGDAPTLHSCLLYGSALGLAYSAAYAIAWVVGIARLRLGRARRSALAIAVLIGATALVCVAAALFPTYQSVALNLLRGNLVPLLGAGTFFLATVLSAIVAARMLSPVALSREAATDASLYAVRRMAVYNPKVYRALTKSHREARRSPRIRMPRAQGSLAVLARSSISLIRHFEAIPALIAAGALIAPLGAALLSGTLAQASTTATILGGETGARILGAASWILLAINSSDAPRTLARVFIADMRNRFFREHLPVSTQVLFVWDVLPGFIVATLSSVVVGCCMEALGASTDKVIDFVLCAVALDVSFACIGALDVADLMPRRVRLTCESATAILAVVVAAASALMPNAIPLAFWIGTVVTAALAMTQLR